MAGGDGVSVDLQECGPGKLMLYGGLGADGKPLNDAWVLDLEKTAWSLIYMAHSDLCPPQVFNCAAHCTLARSACNRGVSECSLKHKLYVDVLLSSLMQICLFWCKCHHATSAVVDTQRCCLQGAVATLHGRRLVCLSSAAGSPKLDLAMSLDIQATAVRHLGINTYKYA